MKNSEVFDSMMSRLGNRQAPLLRTQCILELNQKIRQLESAPQLPWFMASRVSGILDSTQDFIPVPTDFVREVEDGRFKVQNSQGKWKNLVKVQIEKLEDETENADPTLPEGYSLFGGNFYFGPRPDQNYNYKIQVYSRTPVVSDNASDISNPWLIEFFNYTTLSALSIVASLHVKSSEIVQAISPELNIAADGFWKAVEAREHANMDYLIGDSEN